MRRFFPSPSVWVLVGSALLALGRGPSVIDAVGPVCGWRSWQPKKSPGVSQVWGPPVLVASVRVGDGDAILVVDGS